MATQLDVFSALAANKYDHMIESSSDSSPCIQHDVPVSPRLLSKASKPGPGSPLSSSPSLSPLPAGGSSTRSIGSKRDRSSLWSDDEEAYSDFELDRKRVKSRSPSTPLNHHLRLPRWGEAFGELHDDPGITFADKTQRIPELPDKYQYLLLRPPQFGKSLFLSALYHYYDIHEAKHFSRRFGFLPVVTESPDLAPRHNQHLCLSFDLSHIVISSDIGLLKLRLSSKLYCPLGNFVDRYATELGLSSPASFCTGDGADMVAKVFKLVKARGHTLFVGVDNYDWPVQSCSFDRVSTLAHESLVSVQDVQCLVNTHFWSPLLAESGDIDKLFVTGALLVNYPALEHLQPCTAPSLQLSCGFTEQEVTTLAQAVLGETPGGILELQRSNGGYMFSSDGDLAQTLLHPQQTITWISKLSSGCPQSEDFSFRLLKNILKLLPELSDVQGTVSITTLIDFLAAGAVEVSQTDAALGFDAGAVRWNALYHAGALTYDRQLAGTLRVANSAALSVIHAFVDDKFAERYDLRHKFLDPWYTYSIDDDPKPILDLLSRILRDLFRTSFGRKYEPNMHGVLELMLRNRHTIAKKKMDPFLSLNTATRVTIPGHSKVHTWELTTLTLQGMWRATNSNEDAPTVEALRILHEELVQDDEEQLLARPYAIWSPSLQAMETRLAGDFLSPEPEHTEVIAVGGARVFMRQLPSLPGPIPSDPCL